MNDLGFRLDATGSTELWSNTLDMDFVAVDAGPFGGGFMKPPKRELNIFGQINNHTASKFIRELRAIQEYDNRILEENKKLAEDQKVGLDPIRININSPGGSIYHGLAMMDCLDECVARVHTHVQGCCMSMAVHIFLEGDLRTAGRHARFMIHGAGGFESGYLKEMESSVREMRRLVEMLDEQFFELTKIDRQFLDEAETCYQFLDYKEAWELGLLTDEIYGMYDNDKEDEAEDENDTEDNNEKKLPSPDDNVEVLAMEDILDRITKKELKYICENLGLKVSGTKMELAERVLEVAIVAIRDDGAIMVYNKQ